MNGLKQKFKLQEGSESVKLTHLLYIHPSLAMMIVWTNAWCINHGVTPVWTSWIRTEAQNDAAGAVSKTHVEGRAADLSFKEEHGWDRKLKAKYKREFALEFRDVGAQVVDDDGDLISRPIVGEEEGHDHFHIQCRW